VETENRFKAVFEKWTDETTPNEMWNGMEETWKDCTARVVGRTRKQKKKPWINEKVMHMAEEKWEAKMKKNNAEYIGLKSEVQRTLRHDKNT
jgi:hypothetical protein